MKKKYIFIFIVAFAACAGWNILQEKPSPAASSSSSSIVQSMPLPGPLADVREKAYPYMHFRQAMDSKIKKIPMFVSLSALPKSLPQAVIATEDRRFYEHGPIDPIGIVRAGLVNFHSGETIEGGSTISQQVVKNTFLTQERTMTRKAQELVLSVLLEANYSKDEILEIYLNTAYFGADSYGVEQACSNYYAIKPEKLSVAQSAMLAGLLQAPTYYNPLANYEAAKERQKVVLALMADQEIISSPTAAMAYRENLNLRKK